MIVAKLRGREYWENCKRLNKTIEKYEFFSLAVFIAIITSLFNEGDFYKYLPLIIASLMGVMTLGLYMSRRKYLRQPTQEEIQIGEKDN